MLTVEDLKKELGDYTFEILTQGDQSVAIRAIEKAKVWVLSRFARCGKEANLEDEIVKTAWLERALYELYALREQEEKAKDKKENAEDLLSGLLGNCVGEKEGSKFPFAVVREGRLRWNGF